MLTNVNKITLFGRIIKYMVHFLEI